MNAQTILLTCALALIAGCGSSPPTPEWKIDSAASVEQAVQAYLSGRDAVADTEFKRAEREVRRTASADALARVLAVQCAARVAAVLPADCDAVIGAPDAASQTRHYARYLSAQELSGEALSQLPSSQQAAAQSSLAESASALRQVASPVSRLVAAGVMWQRQRLGFEGVQIAVDTASEQGWSRALWHWLSVQKELLVAKGEVERAAFVQRRMDLLSGAALSAPAAAPNPATEAKRP